MALTFLSPGSYVTESDNSLYAPAASPTAVGMIGTATKGPVNTAVLVTNENALVSNFGRPRTKDRGLHTAMEALKAGRLLYYVRIAGPSLSRGFREVLDAGSGATAGQVGPSSNAAPSNLEPGQTVVVNPDGGGNQTATFTAAAATVSSGNLETYNLAAIDSGNPVSLTVAVDGEPAQTITFDGTDPLISNFAAMTAEEAANVINSQLLFGRATVSGGNTVVLNSDTRGTSSSVQVTGGNANDVTDGFNFSTTQANGTGNVADIDAVTAAEVKAVVEGGIAGVTVDVSAQSEVTIRSNTTGSSSSINVSSTSTAVGAAPLINLTPLDSTQSGSDAAAAALTVRFQSRSEGSHSADLSVEITDSTTVGGTKRLVVKNRGVTVETYDRLYKGTVVASGIELVDAINNGDANAGVRSSDFIEVVDLNPATAATLTSQNSATFNLAGIDSGNPVKLVVDIDNTGDQEVTFSGTDPLISNFAAVTAQEAANVINAQISGAAATVVGNDVVLTSSTVSNTSEIDVNAPSSGGDANDAANGFNFSTTAVNGLANGEDPVNGTFVLAAGSDGDDWTAADVVGTGSGGSATGLQIFANPETIGISVLATPGISYASVISGGINVCAGRADCVFIADAPFNLTPEEAVRWHDGDSSLTVTVDQEGRTETNSIAFDSSYAALYHSEVTILDRFNGQNIQIPLSAVAIRTILHTHQVGERWFAPAGLSRTQSDTVLDLAQSPDQGQRDLMQQPANNVNMITNLEGQGPTLLGQKTLQRAPTALDRLNVRFLMITIEKIIARSTKLLMFELNDEVLWRRFQNLVQPVLDDIKTRRGMRDFRIIADSTTTTDTLVENNTFLGKIFIQPTKSAEQIIVDFNLIPQGVNFEEFVQQ